MGWTPRAVSWRCSVNTIGFSGAAMMKLMSVFLGILEWCRAAVLTVGGKKKKRGKRMSQPVVLVYEMVGRW